MKSLRSRLLASHTLIILICLAVIGVALLLLLFRLNLPDRQIYLELTSLSRWLMDRPAIEELTNEFPPRRLTEALARMTETQNVRVLLADRAGRILLDSEQRLLGQDFLAMSTLNKQSTDLIQGSWAGPRQGLQRVRWLFVGRPVSGFNEFGAHWIILARQRPIRQEFEIFGQNLLVLLLQAGLLALAVSILLAWWISRSVAHPIQQVANAAGALASGDYEQPLVPSGPAEVQNLAQTFNQMAGQVRASQQAQQDLVANISHDLKTPLTSIQGFSQAILDGTADDPATVQQAATIIHDEAGRMRRMVDDLLLLARMDAGDIKLDRQPLDIVALLQSCIARVQLRAREKGVTVELNSPQSLPLLYGDGDRLAQLFDNLVDNALKHTPAGGRVKISTEQQGDQVTIGVSDTGPGIPADRLTRIFERFYQLDKSRVREKNDGVGLGLAICKQLAQAHDGQIVAESVLGIGTKFSVTLPSVHAASTVVHRQSHGVARRSSEHSKKP